MWVAVYFFYLVWDRFVALVSFAMDWLVLALFWCLHMVDYACGLWLGQWFGVFCFAVFVWCLSVVLVLWCCCFDVLLFGYLDLLIMFRCLALAGFD